MKARIYIDGASRGNPGNSSAAIIIKDLNGIVLAEEGVFLGKATNNIAETSALDLALSKASEIGITEAEVFSDSSLLVNQFNGKYRIKSKKLLDILHSAHKKAKQFKRIVLFHIPREKNQEADKLANETLNKAAKEKNSEVENILQQDCEQLEFPVKWSVGD